MPTYAYRCAACDHRFETVQSIHDDALEACPECTGNVRRVFGSVGVTFKGSGFYRTDSRPAKSKRDSSTKPSKPASSPAPSTSASSASSTPSA